MHKFENPDPSTLSSEKWHRAFLEVVTGTMYVLTPEGTIEELRADTVEHNKFPTTHVLGKSIREAGFEGEIADRIIQGARDALGSDRMQKLDFALTGRIAGDFEARIVPFGANRTLLIVRDTTAQREAERALREERDRAQSYFDVAATILVALDFAGRVTLVNRMGSELLGCPESMIVGENWFEKFLPPDIREETKNVFRRLMDGEIENVESFENPVLVADGSTRMVAWYNTVLHDPNGQATGTLSSGIDVTERREAETALSESRRALSTLISNLPGVVYRCKNDRQWTMEFISGGCLDLTGYTPAELLDDITFTDLIHPDDRNWLWDAVQEALAEHRAFEVTYRITARDGRDKWVWEKGRAILGEHDEVISLEGFITDITERKRAEAQVEKLTRAIDQADDMVIITDDTGAIEFINPAFERVTGYSAAEVLGKNPRILQSGLHDKKFYQDLWATISAGKVWTGDIFNRKRDGTRYEERMTITPIRNSRGVVTHYVAIKRDVTEERRIGRRLSETQKMEAIGQLAGGIAHDFNNMLTVINEGARYLTDNSAGQQDIAMHARQIHEAGMRCTELTRNLLAFSRPTVFQPRPVSLLAIVEAALVLVRPLVGKKIELQLYADERPSVVLAESGQIQQVITNLCINARDAMPDGGRIEIFVESAEAIAQDTKNLSRPVTGRFARLRLIDTGLGMDEETRRRVFEPFFTTKSVGAGTGLGLSIVYGIVERHRGHIGVSSRPGRGTTIEVYLPAVEVQPQARTEPTREARNPERAASLSRSAGILVVDDEKTVAGVARSVLTRAGHRVWVAHSGNDALDLYNREQDHIDCVVIDMSMPKMDGTECLERIRGLSPSIPAVLMSGYFVSDKEIGKDLRAVFLQKPYDPDELLDSVRRCLSERR